MSTIARSPRSKEEKHSLPSHRRRCIPPHNTNNNHQTKLVFKFYTRRRCWISRQQCPPTLKCGKENKSQVVIPLKLSDEEAEPKKFKFEDSPEFLRKEFLQVDLSSIDERSLCEELVNFSINKHNQGSKGDLQLVELVNAMRKALVGYVYYFTFDAINLRDEETKKTYQAVVYRSIDGRSEVPFFRLKPDDVQEEALSGLNREPPFVTCPPVSGISLEEEEKERSLFLGRHRRFYINRGERFRNYGNKPKFEEENCPKYQTRYRFEVNLLNSHEKSVCEDLANLSIAHFNKHKKADQAALELFGILDAFTWKLDDRLVFCLHYIAKELNEGGETLSIRSEVMYGCGVKERNEVKSFFIEGLNNYPYPPPAFKPRPCHLTDPEELAAYNSQLELTDGFDMPETYSGTWHGKIYPLDLSISKNKMECTQLVKVAVGAFKTELQGFKGELQPVEPFKAMRKVTFKCYVYYLTFDAIYLHDEEDKKTYQAIVYAYWDGRRKVPSCRLKPGSYSGQKVWLWNHPEEASSDSNMKPSLGAVTKDKTRIKPNIASG